MAKQKVKTSSIFFIIGFFILVALIFMFAVEQSQMTAKINNVGEITVSGVSETAIIIVVSILALTILIGLIIKLKFENKRK